jgi:hypothetical protein
MEDGGEGMANLARDQAETNLSPYPALKLGQNTLTFINVAGLKKLDVCFDG